MKYDALDCPYPSRRLTSYAKRGMVATSQSLAAAAGLEILMQGGNAIDAAIATAACLTVVEPTSNGIGGDAFAIVWHNGEMHGLNSSGPAPQSISIESVIKAGYSKMPELGPLAVTVPGAPAAWAELSRRFGKLALAKVLAPAITHASAGYPVSPTVSEAWKNGFARFKKASPEHVFRPWFDTFAPSGSTPRPGEVWRSEAHARTLQSIAETHAESFYRGDLTEKISRFVQQSGGFLSCDDLAAFSPEWVKPISVAYRGYEVWEIPPNGQGLVALMALNILREFSFASRESVDTYHKQIEALKLAFTDGRRFITDPKHMPVSVEQLLSPEYARQRRDLMGEEALMPEPGKPADGGTVYLCTADSEGNMVSYIQSNYAGFGSGLVVPDTGIALQNRGTGFSLDPDHPNHLMGGKKTYHTIIPGFLTRQGEPVGPFGVMGGFMQPQGHLQVVMNAIDHNLSPQACLDAPRWRWDEAKTIVVEHGFPKHIAEALARRGHNMKWSMGSGGFGRGQIIWREPDGVLAGATEPRADGCVASW